MVRKHETASSRLCEKLRAEIVEKELNFHNKLKVCLALALSLTLALAWCVQRDMICVQTDFL